MLITTAKGEAGTRAYFEGHKIVSFHSEAVDEILRSNYEARKDPNNGWSRGRNFRHVAELSPLAYLAALQKYPDIEARDKPAQNAAWRRVLGDPEFALYRTVSRGI